MRVPGVLGGVAPLGTEKATRITRCSDVRTHAAQMLAPAPRWTTSSVLVASPDADTRARIAELLAARSDLIVTTASSALASHDADLLVVHCHSVGGGEAALFTQMRGAREDLLIVVVCDSAAGRSTRRAIDGTVEGLVLAANLDTALLPTVRAVLAGQTSVPRGLRATLRHEALSYREKQILGLVVSGFTNSEIGTRLFLAESTVKSHLSSAFSKLGVKSRSEAAAVILDPDGSVGAGVLALASQDDAPTLAHRRAS